jgi:UDPglucose 6-dehydrogenase
VTFVPTIADAVNGSDAVVILTEWPAFRGIAWRQLAPTMRCPLLIDLRNLYEAQDIVRQGLEYVSLGRQDAEAATLRAAAE